MKATRILLATAFVLVSGLLVRAQNDFSGVAELSLEFIPAHPSMADGLLEVRIKAELGGVTTGSGARPVLTSFSMPVGFDPSYVRLVSVEAGSAPGYSSAGLEYTTPDLANGRGFITVLNRRNSDQNPGTHLELARLFFDLRRPGNALFVLGSARTIHPGTLAAVPEDTGTPVQRISWADRIYGISIEAESELPNLLCPSWFSAQGLWQGMALMNEGTDPASIQMFGYGPDGTLVRTGSATNPSPSMALGGLNQHASLADQIFLSSGAMNVENGWIEGHVDTPNISGFFLQGINGSGGEIRKMDGVSMTYTPASRLIFPLVRDSGRKTEISLANPEKTPVDLSLQVIDSGGHALRTVSAQVPAHGTFVQEITDATEEHGVYVDVRATDGRLIGTERFGSEESLAMLSGQDPELASTRLSGPQFVNGHLGGSLRMDTHIALVNPSENPTTVIVRLHNESGRELAAPAVFSLEGRSLLSVEGWKLFGLADPRTSSPLTVGTVAVESERGITGAISFGDPVRGTYLAALPLMSTASAGRQFFFKQVAVGLLGNIDYFTGLALVNPSPTEGAHINMELHDLDGTILARTTEPFYLGPGNRYAALAQQLIPGFPATQFGGYIRLISDIEVHAYMLIGDNHYNFLSAVE